MDFINSATTILEWLKLAVDDTSDGKRVKERYMMNKNSWQVWYRPDCNIETAYAFLKAWEYTNDDTYLHLARDIYTSIVKLQQSDGHFPFSHTGDRHMYTNDNSEVSIFLFRMAEIDTEWANTYRETALKTTDYLISIQRNDGTWYPDDYELSSRVPFMVAHAVSALSTVYEFTPNKETYKSAIEKALDWISTQILDSGRVLSAYETNNGGEMWRPPSSDQAITIRAFAHAEYFVTDSTKTNEWRINRLKLIGWFDHLIDDSGAVINGLGERVNSADVSFITDHVYTTAFAIEAYQWSYYVDKNSSYLDKAIAIATFASNNLYYSDKAETNGILRGGYNLRDNNWNTSAVIQNSIEEGGGNMIYSGWTNAPICALFFTLNNPNYKPSQETKPYIIKMYNGVKTVNIPIYEVTETANSYLHIYLNSKVYYIPLVNIDDINATNFHLYINGKVKALKKI